METYVLNTMIYIQQNKKSKCMSELGYNLEDIICDVKPYKCGIKHNMIKM